MAIFNLDIDFDKMNEDEQNLMKEKAYHIARKVSDHQIETQSKVVYINDADGIKLTPLVDVLSIMGKVCYIHPTMTLLKIVGSTSSSYVFTNIKMVRPIVIDITNKISHITVTNCKNLIINVTNTSFAGIECINSRRINMTVKSINFVRVTTGSDINIYGLCNDSSMLDIRNSINVSVNNQIIPGCMFNEDRFCYQNDRFLKVKEDDDIFSSGNLSLPNITLLKQFR